MKKQYIDKTVVKAELEKCYNECLKRAKIIDSEYWNAKADAYLNALVILDETTEVKEVEVETKIDTLISDSRKANRAKFIKELKQKIDSYERELSKSGDSTKCDDVDWVTLASDMFDVLQKCLMNY